MASKFEDIYYYNYNYNYNFKSMCLNFVYFFLKWVVFLCRYNQIDKHLHDKMMQQIIFGEIRPSQLLCFEEVFSEEKATYEKVKVHCELRGKCFAMF